MALNRLGTQLSLGLTPFILLALAHPEIPRHYKTSLGLCLATSAGFYLLLRLARKSTTHSSRPFWHWSLSCLLLGSSLAAIPWKILGFPLSIAIVTLGFFIRWLLFAVETWELRIEDLHKAPMPSLATRIRRGATYITGALIPLLLITGLPVVPLLGLSFILTALGQWSAACEIQVNSKPLSQSIARFAHNEPGSFAG